MKKLVFIVSGGEIGDPLFLKEKIDACEPLETVCADRGARHLRVLSGLFRM